MAQYLNYGADVSAGMSKNGGDLFEGGCGCAGKFLGGAELAQNAIAYDQTANAVVHDELHSKHNAALDNLFKLGASELGHGKYNARMARIHNLKLGSYDAQAKAREAVLGAYSGAFKTKFESLTQLSQYLKNLGLGVKEEFVGVKKTIERVVLNLGLVCKKLEDYVAQLETSLKDAGVGTSNEQVQKYFSAIRLTLQFARQQLGAFEALFNGIIGSTSKSVEELANSSQALESVSEELGTKEFLQGIRNILSSGALNADRVELVKNALKEIKLTYEEAVRGGLPKIEVAVQEALRGLSPTSPQSDALLKAEKIIKRNLDVLANKRVDGGEQIPSFYEGGNQVPAFYEGGDVVPSFYSGGSEDIEAYFAGSVVPAFYTGGVREFNPAGSKTKLEREITNKKKIRAVIMSAFATRFTEEFDKCMQALHVIAVKIGSEIPLSDNLDAFRASLVRLGYMSTTDPAKLYALCGYFNDSTSKSIKDDFVAQLKTVSSYIDTIVEMNDYRSCAQYFKSLQDSIKSVIAIVDKFTEEIKEKFGAGELVPAFYEGGDEVESIKPEFAPRYKSPKNFMNAVTKFDYYYKSAQIKRNLSLAGKDINEYSKDYSENVARSIATILQEEQNKYDTLKSKLKLLEKYMPELPSKLGWNDASLDIMGLRGDRPDDNSKWLKELAEGNKMLDQAWETKKKFWRTVEALDMYMKAFTDGIVNNPQDIRDIKSMLDDIPVVSDVYSKKSGEHLTAVFDNFPMYTGHYDDRITKAPEGLRKRNGKHYYAAISELAGNEAPGNHLVTQLPSKVKESKEEAGATFRNLYYLKNLISVFVHIGSKFGGSELRSKSTLSPVHIYDNLVNYLQQSAYSIGFGTGDIKTEDELNTSINSSVKVSTGETQNARSKTFDNQAADVFGTGIESIKGWYYDDNTINNKRKMKPPQAYQKLFGMWMRTAGFEKFEGFSFKVEDEYFTLIMKSICAKIFTVIGTYDVFDRPAEYNGLSAVRMILGGAEETPKVDDAAVELYLRLPLLLEFYKKIFGYDVDKDFDVTSGYPHKHVASGLKISMVPDVEGVFAGLIKIIFRDSRFVKTRAYSDDTVAAIIREVNSIYQKMAQKYPAGEVVNKTIMELVNEINRRYGVLSKQERDDYEKDLNRGNDYSTWTKNYGSLRSRNDPEFDDDSREYAILPGEGIDGDAQAISKAETMLDSTFGSVDPLKSRNKYRIMPGHKEILYRFRCLVEKQFNNTSESFSFANAIKATRTKLKTVSSDADRFSVICGLVRGKDVTTARDSLVWLLFHETVVLGLNTLSAVHSMLARFKNCVLTTDVDKICDFIAENKSVDIAQYCAEFTDDVDSIRTFVFRSVAGVTFAGDTINAATGPFSLLNGKNVNLLKMPQSDDDAKKTTRVVFDSEKIMRTIIETLFSFGEDLQGLVTVKLEQDNINVSFKGLKTLVGDLFESVNYFVDVLRPHLPIDIIDKYLEKETPGSYWWLHEQIMEKIIIGRDKLIGHPNSKEYMSLDRLNERLSSTWKWLVQDDSRLTIGQDLSVFNDVAPVGAGAFSVAPKYGDVFAKLVYYGFDHQLQDTNGNLSNSTVECVDFLSDPYESLHFSGQLGAKMIDTRFVARFKELYSFDEEFSANKSAMFGFNQLVAKFIKQFYDTSVQKMYQGLILPFAGSAFNQSVLDFKQTYPDVIPVLIAKGSAGEGTIMSPSYSLMLKMTPEANRHYAIIKEGLDELYKVDPGAFRPPTGAFNSLGINRLGAAAAAGQPTFGVAVDSVWPLKNTEVHLIAWLQAKLDYTMYNAVKADNTTNIADTSAITVAGYATYLIESMVKRYVGNAASVLGGPASAITGLMPAANFGSEVDFYKAAVAQANMYRTHAGWEYQYPTVMVPVPGAAAPVGRETHYPVPQQPLVKALVDIMSNADNTPSGLLSHMLESIPNNDSINPSNASEIINQLAASTACLWGLVKQIYDQNRGAFAAAAAADQARILATVRSSIKPAYDDVAKSLLAPPRAYVPQSGAPRHTAKYDEVITLSTAVDIINPHMGQTGTLVMARNASVNGLLDAGSINSVGARGTATAVHDSGRFGVRMDPDSEHVLFTSLSDILRNILTSRTLNTQAYVYLQDNVADITFHMKEKMRANLPAFKALFSAMIRRCEFIKHMTREVKLDRGVAPNDLHNPWPFVLKAPVVRSDEVRVRQHGILDSIIRGCTAFVSSCDKVLMEIGDEPKFMELYQNSIKDYRARNGIDPFAPLSTIGSIYKNMRNVANAANAEEAYTTFLPVHSLGSDASKFLYGTRALLHKYDAPSTAHAPGFVSTMDYATMSVPNVEKRKAEALFNAIVRGARYINEIRHFKNILNACPIRTASYDTYSSFCSSDLIYTDGGFNEAAPVAGALTITNKNDMSMVAVTNKTVQSGGASGPVDIYQPTGVDLLVRPIYQTRNTLQDIIQLTENSFRDEQIRKVVAYIAKSVDENKTDLDILNIIDLNIVPINVHALMRDIPLANLYNYSYTCDRLLIELYYGLKNKNAQKLMDQLCSGNTTSENIDLTSAKDMLVALLLNPYREIDHSNSDLVHQMFVGATAIDGLGRPKFISDQIYNGVIFGQMYDSPKKHAEFGPMVDAPRAGNPIQAGDIENICRDYFNRFLSTGVYGPSYNTGTALNYLIRAARLCVGRPTTTVLELFEEPGRDLPMYVSNYIPTAPGLTPGEAQIERYKQESHARAIICIFARIITYYLMLISNALEANNGSYIGNLVDTMHVWINLPIAFSNAADPTPMAELLTMNEILKRYSTDASLDSKWSPTSAMGVYSPNQKLPSHGFYSRMTGKDFTVDKQSSLNLIKLLTAGIEAARARNYDGLIAPDATRNNVVDTDLMSYISPRLLTLLTPDSSRRRNVEYIGVDDSLHYIDHDANSDAHPPRWTSSAARSRPDNINVVSQSQIKSVAVDPNVSDKLVTLSKYRLDTRLIRNLLFIVNLYRSVRIKLQRDLVYDREIIQRSAAITKDSITEFFGNELLGDASRDWVKDRQNRYGY